ncbi:MAG: hypothetical protein ABIL09_03045 [Gemmatimonadota bacterium]
MAREAQRCAAAIPGHCRQALWLALATTLVAAPASAGGLSQPDSRWLLAGGASSFYGGGEMSELAESLGTLLLVLFCSDEDRDCGQCGGDRHDWRRDGEPGYLDGDELSFRVPQAQFGLGLSYRVTAGVALGGRLVCREDYDRNPVRRLWGGGPELVRTFGDEFEAVRPFLSAAALLTRGSARSLEGGRARGLSLSFRAGVSVRLGPSAGYYLQTGYQSDHLRTPAGQPLTTQAVALGFGVTAFLD